MKTGMLAKLCATTCATVMNSAILHVDNFLMIICDDKMKISHQLHFLHNS